VCLGLILTLAPSLVAQTHPGPSPASQPPLTPQVAALLDQALAQAGQTRPGPSRVDALKAIASVFAKAGDNGRAANVLQAAAQAANDWDGARSPGLVEIADAQLKIGDRDGAVKTLADAFEAASKGDSLSSRSYRLAEVAEAQTRAGLPDSARTFEMALADVGRDNPQHEGSEYEHLLESMTRAGAIAKVKVLIGALPNAVEGEICWDRVAGAQAESGDSAGALETIKLILPGGSRDFLLREIAIAQVNHKDIAGARRTASQITRRWNITYVQAQIATAQGLAGDLAGAIAAIDKIDDPYYQTEAYADLCAQAVRKNDTDTARQLVHRMEQLADRNSLDEPRGWRLRSEAFASLGKCQALVGDNERCKRSFEIARDAANQGDDEDTFQGSAKARNMRDLAIAAAEAGQLDTAKSAAAAIRWSNKQVGAYRAIAASQSWRGDLAGALQWINSLDDESARAHALAGAASGLLDRAAAAWQPVQ
jgi:hypothetical protein